MNSPASAVLALLALLGRVQLRAGCEGTPRSFVRRTWTRPRTAPRPWPTSGASFRRCVRRVQVRN